MTMHFWPKVTNITLKRAAGTTTEAASEIQVDAIPIQKRRKWRLQ